jgi:hypothetical protein
MEQTEKNLGKYWLYFFVFLAIMIFMLVGYGTRPFFWTILPFVCTNFARAMDLL